MSEQFDGELFVADQDQDQGIAYDGAEKDSSARSLLPCPSLVYTIYWSAYLKLNQVVTVFAFLKEVSEKIGDELIVADQAYGIAYYGAILKYIQFPIAN